MPRLGRDKNLFVEITARGNARPSDAALELLARAPGLYRLVPAIGRLMVLERVVDNRDRSRAVDRRDPDRREVVLAGVFDAATDLAGVIDYVQMTRLDGTMHIDSGEVKKTLYFRRGAYLSGRSNLRSDRLGSVLVRAGMLTDANRDEVVTALGDMNTDGQRLGNQLVARGLLTTPQVYEGLRLQAEDIFYSTLRLNSGSYYLVSPLDMTEVPAMIRLDIKQLLMEGVRRIDEATKFDEGELRQRKPIPTADLPPDAAERIVDAYNQALVQLFAGVTESLGEMLRGELTGFIEDNEAYQDLFQGVHVGDNGSLGVGVLENLVSFGRAEPLTVLQEGLNELLFFLLFAAGDALDATVEQQLQTRVAEALAALPRET